MKTGKIIALALLAATTLLSLAPSASAHGFRHYSPHGHGHGHVSSGVRWSLAIGVPLGVATGTYYYGQRHHNPIYPTHSTYPTYPTYPTYSVYPAPVHYHRPVVVMPPAVTYVEQSPIIVSTAPAHPASNLWYYCDGAGAYYPYVRECPGGWQAVPAQPAR